MSKITEESEKDLDKHYRGGKTMRQVWKFPISKTTQKTILPLPVSCKILCVGTQGNDPWMWAEVTNPSSSGTKDRTFLTFGTGHDMPDGSHLVYIGTYFLYGGGEVYHVYEEK